MSEKEPTQSMPAAGAKGAPDGTNNPPKLSDGNEAGGDAGSGGRYPNQPTGEGKGFRGGQSGAAYHGAGQLGEDEVTEGGNANAGSKSP
jgi:hypothetical protein